MREIVLTLFTEGHLVDPLQNAAYRSLRQLRRMAEQRPEAFAELERVWHRFATLEAMCDGPVAVIQLGWHRQALGLFAREGRPHMRFLDGPKSWWLDEIRQSLRLAAQQQAARKQLP